VNLAAARRILRFLLVACLVLAAGLVLAALLLGSFGMERSKAFLTLIGLAAGAFLADLLLGSIRLLPLPSMAALVPLVASQIGYYILIWTTARKDDDFWRLWWVGMCAAVTSAHILSLRVAARRLDWVERLTPWCALLTGTLLASLALRRSIVGPLPPLFYWIAAPLAAGSILGSIVVWRRARIAEPRPMARWARWSLFAVSQAALFLMGFYVGMGHSRPNPLDLPSALAGLSIEEVETQAAGDLKKLKTVVEGMDDLVSKSEKFRQELLAKLSAEKREFYTPEEDDRIRWLFVTYLSYRSALLRLVATYSGFEAVRDPETRARCFMIGYTAAAIAYEMALRFVRTYGADDNARRKLNEAEPRWGIVAGMFDRIYESAANERNSRAFNEMAEYYALRRDEWRSAAVWPESDFAWMDRRIQQGLVYVRSNEISRAGYSLERLIQRVKEDAYTPVYSIQSMLSTWIGDARIVQDKPLISLDQIREVAPRLRAGDIILERRNWFLSNAFLPGFWPHSALYVGSPGDLRRLGILEHPEVRAHLAEFEREAPAVIEAVSDGVILNSLSHSLHADYVAVLRPRLTDAQIAQAIVKGFSHLGKPYDFEFDFFTSDKLVCTELVYRSYEGLLHFDLVRVMGRDTLPAIEIVRKFEKERGAGNPELEFVLFLDGKPALGRAELATEQDFCGSAIRDRAFSR
jgi:hypothetical protein